MRPHIALMMAALALAIVVAAFFSLVMLPKEGSPPVPKSIPSLPTSSPVSAPGQNAPTSVAVPRT